MIRERAYLRCIPSRTFADAVEYVISDTFHLIYSIRDIFCVLAFEMVFVCGSFMEFHQSHSDSIARIIFTLNGILPNNAMIKIKALIRMNE